MYDAMLVLSMVSHLFKQVGWLFPVINAMPRRLTKWMSPDAYLVVMEEHDVLLKQCIEVVEQRKTVGTKEKDREQTAGRPSMIEAFLNPTLPEAEKAPERVKGEMFAAIQAGTITSSHALKLATYHTISLPILPTIHENFTDRCLQNKEWMIPTGHTPMSTTSVHIYMTIQPSFPNQGI